MDSNIYSAISHEGNPCIGCASPSCVLCPCYTGCESERDELRSLHVPVIKKENRPKKKIARIAPVVNETKTVQISSEFFGHHDKAAMFIADSNGMSGAGIYEGDAVLFDLELEPRDGDIIIVNIEGVNYCRRYFLDGEKGRFRREDGITQDIVTADFTVIGVMVGLMRKVERAG